ncbi:cytochrome P450 [Ilumatobacter sp.]|uniref:cytochrome P450 n=1 Tax=Ilumatobacter sp. TaxID=1967498 RepID=UPI003AF991F3
MAIEPSRIADPTFWHQPLAERMAQFAELREQGGVLPITVENPLTETMETFHALTRYDEVVHVSKHPDLFCSGQGATSIFDLPMEMLEFFGGFINMDNPRHAHQRRIVAKSFTPTELAGVLDSVEAICTEVINGFCERGEVDLVDVLSQPFPLLIICDMMGIPRSEFQTVLDATNVILSGGDPEYFDEEAGIESFINAGIALSALMGELIEERRSNPTDDLTSKLVNHDLPEDLLTPEEITSFFVLLAVAGNDTTRTAISHGVDLLAHHPEQRAIWQDDVAGVTPTAVEEIVRAAAPVTFMRRTATEDVTVGDVELDEGARLVMFYGAANRDPRAFDHPERFDVRRTPNPHVGFGGPGPHFCLGAHLARRELAVVFREMFRRLPDLEVTGPAVPLASTGIPLVTGIKRLPVRFTPTAPVGNRG